MADDATKSKSCYGLQSAVDYKKKIERQLLTGREVVGRGTGTKREGEAIAEPKTAAIGDWRLATV